MTSCTAHNSGHWMLQRRKGTCGFFLLMFDASSIVGVSSSTLVQSISVMCCCCWFQPNVQPDARLTTSPWTPELRSQGPFVHLKFAPTVPPPYCSHSLGDSGQIWNLSVLYACSPGSLWGCRTSRASSAASGFFRSVLSSFFPFFAARGAGYKEWRRSSQPTIFLLPLLFLESFD